MHTISENKIRMLNPREIKMHSSLTRDYADELGLSLLRDSISAGGIIQPLIVKKVSKNTYQLISGERRLKAALMAGLRRVPCVVHNISEKEILIYYLAENMHHSELSVFDKAKILKQLISIKGVSYSEIAAKLGVTQTTIYSLLQVLRLDDRLARRAATAQLSQEHITALLRLPAEGRAQALDTFISQELSAKKANEYVFSVLNPTVVAENQEEKTPPPKKEKGLKKAAIGDIRLLSNSLAKIVDTLKESGINVNFRKTESEKYTEYRIKIKKETAKESGFAQLTILSS